jgi:hypothetical protein
MKKFAVPLAICFGVAFGLGCNLSAATAQPTVGSTMTVEETDAPTATATAVPGATAGPTPTLVSAADCPPFAFDSFAADFPAINDPALYRGKHYNPMEYRSVVNGDAGELLDDVHGLEELFGDLRRIEFLERLVCNATNGKAYFEVKDALILTLAKDQTVARICWSGGEPVQPVLAVGHVNLDNPQVDYQNTTGWQYERLDAVYRIDLERETFTPLPPEGIVCLEVFEGGD